MQNNVIYSMNKLLVFDRQIEQLHHDQCVVHRLDTGRWLYHCQEQQSSYWLKLQQQGIDLKSEAGFSHELQLYRHLQHCHQQQQSMKAKVTAVCLPHSIWQSSKLRGAPEGLLPQALLVVDSQSFFTSWSADFSTQLHRLIQSLNVLEKLHDCGYVHGDLKSSHFRLYQQQCYLIDFEQCVEIGTATAHAQTATPRYMAPELFHAQKKTIQSDIYALGVIWLQYLNQERWPSRSYVEWAYWHCQQLRAELTDSVVLLQLILQRMLAKNQAQRYASIEEIKLDFARIV